MVNKNSQLSQTKTLCIVTFAIQGIVRWTKVQPRLCEQREAIDGRVTTRSCWWKYFSSCRMLHKLTDRCRTSFASVSGIITSVARDAELLDCKPSNMTPPIRVGDYFARRMFLYFRLITVSYCQFSRRLRLLATRRLLVHELHGHFSRV